MFWRFACSSRQNLISFSSPLLSSIFLPSIRCLATTTQKSVIQKAFMPICKCRLNRFSLLNHQENYLNIPVTLSCRYIHFSQFYFDKSKLEDSLKEKQKQKKVSEISSDIIVEKLPSTENKPTTFSVESVKPSLWKRVVAEVKHYYHGFRLLFLDIRIALRTLLKLFRGKHLTRRERNQFRRAVADLFRLAPFSVFIIIPFAELALPFALKFFPGMLPSTFETSSKRETRLKKELKLKLEMAKFLQDTVEDIAVHTTQSKNKTAAAKNFVDFFRKTRSNNEQPTVEEILQHAKLFQDDLTLDNIERPQLIALCKLIQVPAVGTNEVLRFLIQMKLNRLRRDDELIVEEGVDSLTTAELVSASQARGMRALGVPRKRLKQQLSEWVELHVKHDVPTSLLLLSRVLYLPDSVPAEERVKAAISTLPEKLADEAEVRAAELNLERVDNTALYKALKQEQTEIANEEAEKLKQEEAAKKQAAVTEQATAASEKPVVSAEEITIKSSDSSETLSEGPVLVDSARVISDDNKITLKEIDVLDEAISKIGSIDQSNTDSVKVELNELREDVEEYKSDVKTLTKEIKLEEITADLENTKPAERLQKRISKMIEKMELIVEDLEKSAQKSDSGNAEEVAVAVHDLVETLQSLTKLPEEKLRSIFDALDTDKDGHIDVKEASKIIQILNKEDVEVTAPQLEQIVQLLAKQTESVEKEFEDQSKVEKPSNNL